MSSGAPPITAARFAAALKDLPISALHSKAAELRNSLNHLESSNEQLKPFADDGDADCADAIRENLDVMGRFRGRIDLLKAEVEERGMPWVEDEKESGFADTSEDGERRAMLNGTADAEEEEEEDAAAEETHEQTANTARPSGRLTDEELQRRIQQQMDDMDQDDGDGGMHL